MAHASANVYNYFDFFKFEDKVVLYPFSELDLNNVSIAKNTYTDSGLLYQKEDSSVERIIIYTDGFGRFNTLTNGISIVELYKKHIEVINNLSYFTGTVTENYQPVSRKVRLYLRSTGEFVAETVSKSDGSYELKTPFEGEHFIIAFDADDAPDFNAIIIDRAVGDPIE